MSFKIFLKKCSFCGIMICGTKWLDIGRLNYTTRPNAVLDFLLQPHIWSYLTRKSNDLMIPLSNRRAITIDQATSRRTTVSATAIAIM
jgi:hypothetical protein